MEGKAAKPKIKLTGKQWGIVITAVLMYFFAPTFGAVSTTYQLMPDVFGVAPAEASWIGSISNACSCIAGLLVGLFVGKNVSYRVGCIFATAMFTVFGALPFLWQDITWPMLLASRVLFGLGIGMFNPIVQAILTRMIVEEGPRAAAIGFINIAFAIGGIFGSMIVGALATTSWQNGYAFYLFCVIPLILSIIFIHDKDIVNAMENEKPGEVLDQAKVEQAEKAAEEGVTERRHIPAAAWAFIIIFCLSTLCSQCFFNYIGLAMVFSGADPLLIGTVFSVFTVASILIALVNAPLWKGLRLWNFPLCFVLMAIGYVCCLGGFFTGGVALFFAAAAVIGFGCCLGGMVIPMAMSTICSAASLTLAIAIQEIARNLGGFLSTPWMMAIGGSFGDVPDVQFTAVIVLCVIGAVIAGVLAARFNKRFKNVEMQMPPM